MTGSPGAEFSLVETGVFHANECTEVVDLTEDLWLLSVFRLIFMGLTSYTKTE